MLSRPLMPGVALRLPEPRDADELYAVVDANRAHLADWMPWAPGQTLSSTVDYIQRTRQALADGSGYETIIAVDGRIAGMAGVVRLVSAHRHAEVGYWLAAEHQGRGIMTAAVRAHVEHGFDALALHRIMIKAGVHNHRSRAIAERLGFTHEGTERDGEWLGDRFHDLACYSMLASEWPRAEA